MLRARIASRARGRTSAGYHEEADGSLGDGALPEPEVPEGRHDAPQRLQRPPPPPGAAMASSVSLREPPAHCAP